MSEILLFLSQATLKQKKEFLRYLRLLKSKVSYPSGRLPSVA